MVALGNTLEGIADNTVLTGGVGGNTGPGGNYFDVVTTPATGGSIKASTAASLHGTVGCRVIIGTVIGSGHLDWSTQLGTFTECYSVIYMKLPTTFAGGGIGGGGLAQLRSGAGLAARIDCNASKFLTLKNAAGTAVFTSTQTVPLGTWFRLETHYVLSTTVGVIEARIFSGANLETNTPDFTLLGTGMVLTANADQIYNGVVSAPINLVCDFDAVKITTGAGTWLGPAVALPQFTTLPTSITDSTGLTSNSGTVLNAITDLTSGNPALTTFASGGTGSKLEGVVGPLAMPGTGLPLIVTVYIDKL